MTGRLHGALTALLVAALASAVAPATVSCGGGRTRSSVFASDWRDDEGRSVAWVADRLRGVVIPPAADVVVGVGGNGGKVIGQPLGTGARWSFTHALDARPVTAGTLVLGSGGGEVFALEAATGKKLWVRPTGGLPLRGAGDDGTTTVITFGRGAGQTGSTMLAVARDGNVVRQLETDKELGVPAVVSGLAFVPWGSQYVSVVDLTNGDEPARILFREKVGRAWVQNGQLYFGEVGMFRFDENIAGASRGRASHAGIPSRELPGSPVLMPPPSEHAALAASARDKIRLYARPGPGRGALELESARFYATYFRIVFGFDAQKGSLSWVRSQPNDVLAGAAANGGVVLCDEQGKVTVLDAATGSSLANQDLGEAVKSCVVQVDAYAPPAAPAQPAALATQLAEVLTSRDAELVTAQRLLLREMATLPDETATKVLIDLASDPQTPPQLLTDARAALTERRTGSRHMIAALDRHYDFLHDVLRPPPVGPMARALAAMNDKAAAPALAAHLVDPANEEEDVKQAAAALAILADTKELPALKQFFVLHRAAADTDELQAAVVSTGQAILRVGGKDGRTLVEKGAADPVTQENVRTKLKGLLEATKASTPEKPAPADKPATKAPPKPAAAAQ